MGEIRQKLPCLSKLGGSTNFNTVPLWLSLGSILTVWRIFCKFDIYSQFFHNNSAEKCRSEHPKDEKDASQGDLNLSLQNFSSEMNSFAVIFEMPKIADFAHFEPLWNKLKKDFSNRMLLFIKDSCTWII